MFTWAGVERKRRRLSMLEIKNVSSGYGESLILRDISLKVGSGSLVCVLGSNGVGKSTLLKTIMGIINPVSGGILWQDENIEKLKGWERTRLGIGYVPQGRDIFPFLTVHENLVLGLEAEGLKASRIKKRAAEMYDIFPILNPIKKRKGGNLSGGQQQILAIARVLLREPEILILDEPSEGIQPSIVQQINDTLGMIKQRGVSILLVEQYPDFALTHADGYYLMAHGNLTDGGPVTSENRESIRANIQI